MLQPSDVTDICPDAILHKRGEKYIVLMPEDLEEEERKIRALCERWKVDYEIMYRTNCQVWTRVMGYYRPVSMWNTGKQAEYADRKTFVPPTAEKAQKTLNM